MTYARAEVERNLKTVTELGSNRESRRNNNMVEIAVVRNELDRTAGKLEDFRGSL